MKLEEKYAHVTSEAVAEMTLEQLEDLQHQISEETATIQMSLELLEQTGGISREIAAQIQDYLPPVMVVESFTNTVTHTNYEMAKESLSTALKIVGAIGVIAAVGGLVYLFTRSRNADKGAVNEKGQAQVEKLSRASKDLEKGIDSILADAKSQLDKSDEPTPEQIAQWDKRSAEINQKWEREAEERRQKAETDSLMRAGQGECNAFTWYALKEMAMGKTDFKVVSLVGSIYSAIRWTFDIDYKELLVPAIDGAERFSRSGNEKDLEKVRDMMHRRPAANVQSSFVAITQAVKTHLIAAHVPTSGKWDTPDQAFKFFMSWAEGPAKVDDFAEKTIRGAILEGGYKFIPPDYVKIIKEIDHLLDIGNDLAKQEKRLKDIKELPQEISGALDIYVSATKENLKLVDMLSTLIHLEVSAYNSMLKFANARLRGNVEGTLEGLRSLMVDPEVTPAMKVALGKAVANIVKSMQ